MAMRNKQFAQGKGRTSRASKQLIPRSVRPPMHTWTKRGMVPELDVQLLYTSVVTAGAGVSTAYKLFNPNSYIPEYSGTQAAAEFVNYATIYDFYRVIKFKIEVDIVNQDTTTAIIVFLCHNENFNGESVGNLSGNPFAETKTLGSVNGASARARWSKTLNVSTLVGSNAPEVADSYRALINANPADVVWAGFGLYGTGVMTSGIAGTVRITQYVRFYNSDLASQTTAPGLTSKQELDIIQARREARRVMKVNSSSQGPAAVNKQ